MTRLDEPDADHASDDARATGEAPEAPIDSAYETLVQFLYRAPVGLVQTSIDGSIEMMNPMSVNLLMAASPDSDLDNLFDALGALAPDLRAQAAACKDPGGVICDALRLVMPNRASPDTAPRTLSLDLSKLDATRLMAMLSDVTVEVQREHSGLAFHLDAASRVDRLTQLPNRAVVCERIDRALARASVDPACDFVVLFLDCDRFKQINDTLGHAAGNTVLRTIAERLQAVVRQHPADRRGTNEANMVARLGSDEFVVFVDDVASSDEVATLVDGVLDVLGQPYLVDALPVHTTVSIGAIVRPQVVGDADAVLRDASIAMVEAKRAGGARHVRFEAAMRERARLLGCIEGDLRRGLATGELFVVYQPVVAFRSPRSDDGNGPVGESDCGSSSMARSAGVEALVRWNHPVRGLVSPIDFIGVAERCGLIGALGAFVLATACRQFVSWQATLGARAPRLLAVNVSRGQLVEPGFADYVAEVLRSTGMAAAHLQLEITESLAAQDKAIQQRLHELKALGLTLALDDFGTGYSSLASLHELPVDTVKIDQSFVAEAVSSTYHRVLIEATVRVANSLRMNTVAEGIETEAQAALLCGLGCDKGQGYLFSKPLGAVELARWLEADR